MKNKIIIAITGHRDIIQTKKLTHRINKFFDQLIKEYEEITLLSALAIGADQMVAEIFLEKQKENKHLYLIVPMPFELARYKEDFSAKELTNFLLLLKQSHHFFQVAHSSTNPYESLGIYLVENTQLLLALWDGTFNHKSGGTGDVISYAKKEKKKFLHFHSKRKNK